MDLKEYIKSLVRKQLEEMSTTAGVPGYMTPFAFSKGKGKNAATKQAGKEGWKVTKGETEMPADSKIRDYKSLWNKKKKRKKIYEAETEFKIGDIVKYGKLDWEIIDILPNNLFRLEQQPSPNVKTTVIPDAIKRENPEGPIKESNYDAKSTYGQASNYTAASGYTGGGIKGDDYYKKESMSESIINIVKEELLNEVTYHKFKNEVKFRTKNEQLHKAIREVKRKLQEIDRIVEYTSRMKQELSEGEEGLKYWKKTESNIATISEMVNHLNNKIKNLNQ